MPMKGCKDISERSQESNDPSVNELVIQVNDESSSHNNNYAITMKSKNVDVDRLLPLAEEWIKEHKQKTWQGV